MQVIDECMQAYKLGFKSFNKSARLSTLAKGGKTKAGRTKSHLIDSHESGG